MQTQDDERWSQQVADLHADGEAGQRFLDFFLFWFETADKLYDEWVDGNPNAMIVVRAALDLAENEFGYLDTNLIGQMLTVATMHWARGAEMAKTMTSIEQRVMQQALAMKIADLQASAAAE